MKPAGSPFRLQSLIKLGEAYEKGSEWGKAVSAYDDLARNAPNKDVAKSAAARAALLRKEHKGTAVPAPASGASVDDGGEGSTLVDTPDEAPAPKKGRKTTKKSK
jgi:hypothetical protein